MQWDASNLQSLCQDLNNKTKKHILMDYEYQRSLWIWNCACFVRGIDYMKSNINNLKFECLFSGNIRVIRLMTVCYQRVALSTKKQSLIRGPSAALSSDAAMINAMSFTVKWAVLLQYWSRPKKRNESKKFRVFSEGTLMLPYTQR